MSGYTPVFDTVFDGTLCGQWPTLPVWLTILPLADWRGHIDMTPQAIAARTGWPLDLLAKGIEELCKPDPYSRSKVEEGRRLVPIDPDRPWGWRVVNFALYRSKASGRDQISDGRNADKVRRYKERHRRTPDDTEGHRGTPRDTQEHQGDTHSYSNTDSSLRDGQTPSAFDRFWAVYPKKVKRKTSAEIWARKRLDARIDVLLEDVKQRLASDRRWREGYIPDPPTYLNQERWNDELESSKTPRGFCA